MKKPWTEQEDEKLLAALEADRTRKWIVALAKRRRRAGQTTNNPLYS